jgi:hypothetical protein
LEPVEINAGAWYLRALRHDDWLSETAYCWAVCEPTSGEPVAQIVLDPADGTVRMDARDGNAQAAAAAEKAVRRFAASALAPP